MQDKKPKGNLFIFTGPSGAGKTTILESVLSSSKKCVKVTTCTTRAPREGEKDGKDYNFFSKEKFLDLLKKNSFFEHALVYGNYYGSLKSDIENVLASGKNVLMSVDVQGAVTIKKNYPSSKIIFISPPSIDALRKRIENRGKDSKEVVEKRIAVAKSEMEYEKEFDFVVVNDVLKKAIIDAKNIVESN